MQRKNKRSWRNVLPFVVVAAIAIVITTKNAISQNGSIKLPTLFAQAPHLDDIWKSKQAPAKTGDGTDNAPNRKDASTQPATPTKPAAEPELSKKEVWSKPISPQVRLVLEKSMRPHPGLSPEEIEKARKAFPKADIPILQPDYLISLTLFREERENNKINSQQLWTRQFSGYKGVNPSFSIRDAILDGEQVVIVYSQMNSISVETAKVGTTSDGKTAQGLAVGRKPYSKEVVTDVTISAGSPNTPNSYRKITLSWLNGAKSEYSFINGKWVETLKYVKPVDPDEVYLQQLRQRLKKEGREPAPVDDTAPDFAAKQRQKYEAGLKNLTPEERKEAMEQYDRETTPHLGPQPDDEK